MDHQIWLLRNVGWWCLLPIAVPATAFIGHANWQLAVGYRGMAVVTVMVGAGVGLVLAGMYRLNQVAVRDELEPRRRELQALLAGLRDPPPDAQE